MKHVLALCSCLLASLAAFAAAPEKYEVIDHPVFVQSLSSAPLASASQAHSYHDGRTAPSEAITTQHNGDVRHGQYTRRVGPLRRVARWIFRGRRCR